MRLVISKQSKSIQETEMLGNLNGWYGFISKLSHEVNNGLHSHLLRAYPEWHYMQANDLKKKTNNFVSQVSVE